MYKKILIVASKLDAAGINITTQLSKFGEYDFYLVDKEIIFTENLNQEKLNQYDFIVFASKHVSKNKKKLFLFTPQEIGVWPNSEEKREKYVRHLLFS